MSLPNWTAGVHHDGSALYVSNPLPAHGETVTLTLRVPISAPSIERIVIRSAPDGENHLEPMHESRRDQLFAYWTGTLHAVNPINPYRFRLYTTDGVFYLTAAGISNADRPDWADFKLLADFAAPTWVSSAVFYQIFPDRFAQGDPSLAVQPGEWTTEIRGRRFTTQQRTWGELPLPWPESGSLDFYGGDLPGIAQKLDYLADLGVNALYLTPIFTSYSNHRYDVADFNEIDPHVGGNEGLAALRNALDNFHMHLILDITLNHCGWRNTWFLHAQADPAGSYGEMFTFYNNDPQKYESWLGVSTLPKLNYRSEALRNRLYHDRDSILRQWLRPPYRIDGWRLDVANMQGRQGAIQLGHKLGRQLRHAVKAESTEAYIFGEHFYDGTPHLQGDELDASMNYAGFTSPLLRWLSGHELPYNPQRPRHLLDSVALIDTWRQYRAAVPWVIARQQFNSLDSHDTARMFTMLDEDKSLFKLAVLCLMTYPGAPCVYYGDEIGLPGGQDPDNRRTMPWDSAAWDTDLRTHYQTLIKLRRTASALIDGGYQDLYAEGDVIAYQRQSTDQRLIVVGCRGSHGADNVTIPVWTAGVADGAQLVDRLGGGTYTVAQGNLVLGSLAHGAALLLEQI